MIIHIFNERVSVFKELSLTASSMYPIYIDGKIIANLSSDVDAWVLRTTEGYYSPEAIKDAVKLQQYYIYNIISSKTKEVFNVVLTMRYYPEAKVFAISNQLIIGNTPACDLCLPVKNIKRESLRLELTAAGWTAQTDSRNFFIGKARAIKEQKILCGDSISYYGLKIIMLHNSFILCSPYRFIKKSPRIKPAGPEPVYEPKQSNLGEAYDIDTPLYAEEDYYYKSPRFNYTIEQATIKIDEPPSPMNTAELPLIVTLGPQLTMAAASAISIIAMMTSISSGTDGNLRMILSIVTMVISLLGALVWPTVTRKINKHRSQKNENRRQTKYKEYLARKKEQLDSIKTIQKRILLNNNPPIDQCVQIIDSRNERLWQRSIDHGDFLAVRIGIGKFKTELLLKDPEERFSIDDVDPMFVELERIIKESREIENAPITYNFTNQIIDAVIGQADLVKNFLDCVFLQMMTFHSYADLKIITFTTEPDKWDYLKIAPHCWDNEHNTRYFATTIEKLSIITNELEKIFDARKANDEEEKQEDDGEKEKVADLSYRDFKPYYLFFIDDMTAVRNVSLINKILYYKRNIGFSIITAAQNVTMLPNETSDFISITPERSAIVKTGENESQQFFEADFNKGSIDMNLCMQKLANIPIKIEKGRFELPKSLPFLELYECGRVEQLNCLARWKENDPSVSLSVPIGIDQNNEIFRMDIHEKAYGPHGLIAGTTGSGKSEWIITFILSLATNFSPNEVQFVLIDYKGGGLAKSFENAQMGIKLPHLAGTITNLDKSEIFRAISAIESELKRRQALFNAAREKIHEGSMDIYKYQQYYRQGIVDEPLSHLLIICDEFAELRQQEPDFMDQLISTSRIGRSLGVHLILATQKPSGVVNDQIWSNSKFKIALKVQNKTDSSEIIKKPDAAFLKQTGSFYLQVGADDYFNLGQVAWTGAKYYPSNTARRKIDDSIQCIDDVGRITNTLKNEQVVEDKGEQLFNIVSYLSDISKKTIVLSRPMWLENISSKSLLENVKKKYGVLPAKKYTYSTLIGEYDEPRRQEQGPLRIDLATGNIAIVGKADGSIEQLISTIVWSSICDHTPAEIAYYIIDFGSETMKKFAKFPHVGEVIFQDEIDKVAGIINLVGEEINRRKEILSNYNGSFDFYNRTQEEKMSLIVVVVNNYDVVGERAPKAMDYFMDLFRDGPKYGVVFIISTNAANSLGSRLLQFFNHTIVMQISDDTLYRSITNCRRELIPRKVLGRGICKLDASNADSYCEFQTAMIDTEEEELKTIKEYADECVEVYKCKVKQLAKIPDDVTSNDLAHHITTLSNVPIGINVYEKNLASYAFDAQKLHIITSKNINENIGFIYAITTILTKIPNVKVRVLDLLGIFKKPILDIQMFDQDPNVVFAALEKDVRTRTDAQDCGVNIIIGIGKYKQILSKAGIEIFRELFENVKNSKKSIYVFVDNYEDIRNLRLEKWYRDINTGYGIWLGQGLDSQSIFNGAKLSDEDKKFKFDGLGYIIENDKCAIIKTVMDKDD